MRHSNNAPEQKNNREPAPVGTWVLLCSIALAMLAGWLFLYFGVFLPRGSIH